MIFIVVMMFLRNKKNVQENKDSHRTARSELKEVSECKLTGSKLVLATAEPQIKRKERLIMSTPPMEVAETIEKEVRRQQE